MPVRRNRLLAGATLLGALGLVAAALAAHHKAQPKHLLTVTPRVLYRSGLLRPSNFEQVVDELGIRTVVNLLPYEGLAGEALARWQDEQRIALERGIRLLGLPMAPDTPPTDAQVERWNELFDTPENLPVLVHCEYGVVRTGMLVAVYEMERLGVSGAQAFAQMPAFGHDLAAPKRKAMREFILGYRARAARGERAARGDGAASREAAP